MRVNFYLDKKHKDKKGKALIFVYVNFDNKRVKISTGQKVNPLLWSDSNQRMKPKTELAETINDYLQSIDTEIQLLEAQAKRDRIPITTQYMKSRLTFIKKYILMEEGKNGKQERKVIRGDFPFYEVFDEFMKYHEKQWGEGTKKNFRTLKAKLEEFEKDKRYKLEFGSLNREFLDKYIDWHIERKVYNSHTHKNIKLLKWFLEWANKHDNRYNRYLHYKNWTFKELKKRLPVPGPDDNIIFLSVEEVQKLGKYKPDNKSLERVRDVFLFSCFSGFRFCDIQRLRKTDIVEGFINIVEKKGKKIHKQPLNSMTAGILQKYQNEPGELALPVISNQKTNSYLKTLCKDADISAKDSYINYIGTEVVKETKPKHRLITFHSGRKSFTSNCDALGISNLVTRRFTGHTSNAMNRYLEVTPERMQEEMKKFDTVFKLKIV